MYKILKLTIYVLVTLGLMYASYSFGYNKGFDNIPAIEKVSGVSNKESQVADVDFNIFWDVWKKLEEKYVDRADLNKQDMVYGAIEGLVRSTGDPYSSFFKPESAKIFKEDISGSFSGIGAEIGFRKELLTIISPLKGSPAEKAGIKTGDIIVKVDGKETASWSIEEAVSHIRGERGTDVTLTIARDGLKDFKDIAITRDTIQVPTIDYEMKDGNIGYIKLYNFTGDASYSFRAAAQELAQKGAQKFIVDLRGNPGGFLDAAIETASLVVPKGEIISTERFGNGEEDNVYRSKGYGTLEGKPLVVLINEGSASASEIFAGAVKGKDKVKVLGDKSFGKGSVQEVVDVTDNTFLKVTIAKWLTPDGSSIQGNGITPDIEISDNPDTEKDEQLDKAIETVKSL